MIDSDKFGSRVLEVDVVIAPKVGNAKGGVDPTPEKV